MQKLSGLCLVAVIGGLGLFAVGLADEEKVSLDGVPKAVIQAVQQKFPQAKITEAEKEDEDGQIVYELTIKFEGKEIEVSVKPDGTILEIEAEGDGDQKGDKASEDSAKWTSDFSMEKENLISTGRNPYFILEPGFQLVLEGNNEQLTITVLNETKMVDGVETRVVEERETKRGKLVEVSRNFFAISQKTNSVYYLGEEVDIYKDGKIVNHEGAWLAGEKDARFGLVMPGLPLLGAKYYQEIAPGTAMDRAEIESLDTTVNTAAGEFKRCLKVEESTPLEPGHEEFKYYAPGIGLIQDGSLKLVKSGKVELPRK